MNPRHSGKLDIPRRKAIRLTTRQALVETSFLNVEQLPVVMKPVIDGLKATDWVASHRDYINQHLSKYGAILFRNFNVKTVDGFEQFMRSLSGELLEYRYRSTARQRVGHRIYMSTDYPPSALLPLHCEMAYQRDWPMKIAFFCLQPPQQGGETPIADNRKVSKQIPEPIRERFVNNGVMYIRNYGYSVDLNWQDAFQTTNPADVERYCLEADIDFEWQNNGQLRTSQISQSIAVHPKTQDTVWFNAAHLHHVSSFSAAVYSQLLQDIPEQNLPRNAYYGDGSPIQTSVLDQVKALYQKASIYFPWQRGDILLLDNMLVAHGRAPFSGPRRIVVGMSELRTDTDLDYSEPIQRN